MELPDALKEEETNNNNSEESDNGDEDKVNKEGEDEESAETVVIYADDNTPNCSANSIEELKEKTQRLAERAVKWFTHNQMIVSAEKTKLIYMGSKKTTANKIPEDFDTSIQVGNKVVSHSKSEKLLGLVIMNL